MTNIEEAGKIFADSLLETIQDVGLSTQLKDPTDAFSSGVYFGAVQGYKRGMNHALELLTKYLPDVYNEIVQSNFDMSVNWPEKFQLIVLKKEFGIE